MKLIAILAGVVAVGASLLFVLSGWKPNHSRTQVRVNWVIPVDFHGKLQIKSPSRKTGFFDPEELTFVVPPNGEITDPQGGRLLGEQFWQMGWCKLSNGKTLPRDFSDTAPSIVAFRFVPDGYGTTVAYVGKRADRDRDLGMPTQETVHGVGQASAVIN